MAPLRLDLRRFLDGRLFEQLFLRSVALCSEQNLLEGTHLSIDGFEGDGLEPLLERARFALPELRSVGADQGYAAERVWRTCEGRRIVAYIPPQRTMLPPAGERPRTEPQRQALAARERCKSERGIWAHRRRMSDAEGVISELKLRHGLGRARSRGTPLFHLQLLLGCTAINLKRLAAHLPQAAEGAAAGEAAQAGAAQAPNAALAASRDLDARTPAAAASNSLTVWTYPVCLN